jgi:hypothetical protein
MMLSNQYFDRSLAVPLAILPDLNLNLIVLIPHATWLEIFFTTTGNYYWN